MGLYLQSHAYMWLALKYLKGVQVVTIEKDPGFLFHSFLSDESQQWEVFMTTEVSNKTFLDWS